MTEASSGGAEFDVLGIGNAILDVLVHADDALLEAHQLNKGTMTLIDADTADALYAQVQDAVECSGGSAANTMVGLASLGSRAAYIGKVRDDKLGASFASDLQAAGVTYRTLAATDGPGTARCLVLVTPDAQRTMQTFLGASAFLSPDDVDGELVRAAKVTYLEGYLWDPEPAKQAFLKAAKIAHAASRKVSLTLSDPFCVDRHRADFMTLVSDHVDLLFANEQEALALFEVDEVAAAVKALRGRCETAVITRGAAGALVVQGDQVVEVPAEPGVDVVDTTGAGDLFAAGFIHGWTQGLDARSCARFGVTAAAEVISHFGARPQDDLQRRIKEIRG